MTNTVNIISFVILGAAVIFYAFASHHHRSVQRQHLSLLQNVACRFGYEAGMKHALEDKKYDDSIPDDFLHTYYE